MIDVDQAHGGFDTLAKLKADGAFPDGLQVSTGSDGLHLYFAHPGRTVRNSVGALGPGVDVRGDGGYVIAPPSRHASGGTYRWKGPLLIPHLPDHLLDRVGQRELGRARRPDPPGPSSPDAWARKALEAETTSVRTTAPGGRNRRLNLAAFNLGQIVGNGLLDTTVVVEELHRAALATGLVSREALRTIRSGLQAGMQTPRGPTTSRAADTSSVDHEPDIGIQSG